MAIRKLRMNNKHRGRQRNTGDNIRAIRDGSLIVTKQQITLEDGSMSSNFIKKALALRKCFFLWWRRSGSNR